MANISSLKPQAVQIRDEETAGANTANRVGSLLVNIIDSASVIDNLGLATTTKDGIMSKEDKAKLDNLLFDIKPYCNLNSTLAKSSIDGKICVYNGIYCNVYSGVKIDGTYLIETIAFIVMNRASLYGFVFMVEGYTTCRCVAKGCISGLNSGNVTYLEGNTHAEFCWRHALEMISYADATQTNHGNMSADDKVKLDNIPSVAIATIDVDSSSDSINSAHSEREYFDLPLDSGEYYIKVTCLQMKNATTATGNSIDNISGDNATEIYGSYATTGLLYEGITTIADSLKISCSLEKYNVEMVYKIEYLKL